MKNIALGQYYPSDSCVHHLDGRVKLVLSILFIISSFFCRSAVSFTFLLIGTLALVFISKIPLKIILRHSIYFAFYFCYQYVFHQRRGSAAV